MLVEIVPNNKWGTLTKKLREREDAVSQVSGSGSRRLEEDS